MLARVLAPPRLAVARVSAAVMALPAWVVLSFLLVPQWIVIAVVASIGRHNGFLFYGGGDETWYYTTAWVLGHGHMPQGNIGYGYSFLLAPLARIGGPNILHGLPLVIAFNAVLLTPIALLCIYGIAKTIGGRGFAYLVSLLWTVFPLLTLEYFYHRYHYKLINIGLVNELGLTSMGDFPSMVFLLVAAYFALRSVLLRSSPDALLAGAATGFAIVVKPSNAIFLPAPIAAFIVARHGRGLQFLTLGLFPAIATLVLWKYRGVGHLPLFSNKTTALAIGRFTDLPLGGIGIHRYDSIDWGVFTGNMNQLKEYAWSRRLLGWLAVAGTIALARRAGAAAVLIAGWFAITFFLKAASPGASILSGSFLRYFIPGYPAFFLLLVSTPLLVPIYGNALALRGRAPAQPYGERTRMGILVVVAFLSFAPLVTFALLPTLTKPQAVRFPFLDQYIPANQFALTATEYAGVVHLSWKKLPSPGAHPFFDVLRESQNTVLCNPVAHAVASCTWEPFPTRPLAVTSKTSLEDHPPPGHWVYHVVLKASPTPARRFGDYLVISRAASVDIAG